MAKQRTQRHAKNNYSTLEQPSIVMWVVAFLLVLSLVVGLYFLHKIDLKNSAEKLLSPLVSPLTENTTPVKFEYYNHVPTQAELTPAVTPVNHPPQSSQPPEITNMKLIPVTGTKTTTSSDKSYSLQIASFRQLSDAQASKDKLITAGFPATVEKATIKGTDWYRVMVGPYPDLQLTQAAQEALASKHVKALLVGK